MGKLSGLVPDEAPAAPAGKLSGLVEVSPAQEAASAAARRAQARGEQNVVENLVDDVKELPTNLLRAGKAYTAAAGEDIGQAVDAYKEGWNEGGLVGAIEKGTLINPERRKV